jgi:hypothetical protein
MALRHWKEFLPSLYEELQERGDLMKEAELAASKTLDEIVELREQGYQLHEAEEVVLPKYILLTPSQQDDWEDLMTPEDRERLSLQSSVFRLVERAKSL